MRILILVAICFFSKVSYAQLHTISDDFEGNGTISSWYGGDCGMDNHYANPYPSSINSSATVLKYADVGALYAHIGFDGVGNFNLTQVAANITFI